MQNSNTIQGQFNATGSNIILAAPMGTDYMTVFNQTAGGGPNGTDGTSTSIRASDGTSYYWQLGMPARSGWEYQTNGAGNATLLKYISSGGFTAVTNPLVNAQDQVLNLGTPVVGGAGNTAITQSSGSPAVVTVSTTSIANLVGFNIVKFTNVGSTGTLLNGINFSVDSINSGAGTFNLTDTQAASYSGFAAAATTATMTGVNPLYYWYPPVLTVLNIASIGSGQSVVTTTVTAPYVVGQTIRFNIPKGSNYNWGLSGLNGLTANIVGVTPAVAGVSSATFTIDVDVAQYGSWNLPGSASVPMTTAGVQWATVTPVGFVASQIIDINGNFIPTNSFNDSEFNQGYVGILLAGGAADQPGGRIVSSKADVVFWKIGKSFSNQIGLNPVPPLPPLGS